MNHIPAPHPREPVAGPWFMYTKPDNIGRVHLIGVAREIWVSEAGFRRFFEIPDDDHLEGWWMIVNKKLSETAHAVGKVFKRNEHQPRFQILFIDKSHGALMGHAIRTTVSRSAN